MKHQPAYFTVTKGDDGFLLLEKGKPIVVAPTHQEAVAQGIQRVYRAIKEQKHGKAASE
jgi:hypothetical protein